MPGKPPNVILIGLMGVGKSTLALRLCRELGWALLDTDARIEEQAGMSVSEIFRTQGEDAFRTMETRLLETLGDTRHTVISTGGGMVVRPENRALLAALGTVVWLHADESVIFGRVSRNTQRPLLQTDDPRGTLHRLLVEREPLYQSLADLCIDTGKLPRSQSLERILRHLQPPESVA